MVSAKNHVLSSKFYTGTELSLRVESYIVSLSYIIEPNSVRRCLINLNKILGEADSVFFGICR